MNYLLIENRGEADLIALTLMGASSKRDADDKIGVFGTGFKNAISILLRNNIGIELFFGQKRISCKTRPVVFREKTFNQIIFVVEGREIETGFTTDMGLRWQTEGALREIISNALDEEGGILSEWDTEPSGASGRTRAFVEMTDAVMKIYGNCGKHFLRLRDTKAVFDFEGGKLWPKYDSEGTRIYRRGVLVFESPRASVFDYEFNDIDITEERKSSDWDVNYKFGHSVDLFPRDAKAKIIHALSRDGFEAHCDYIGGLASGDWKELFKDQVAANSNLLDSAVGIYLPKNCIRVTEKWENALGATGVTTSSAYLSRVHKAGGIPVAPTEIEEKGILWAIEFVQKFGYVVDRDKIEVFICPKNGYRMGEFDKESGKILIARNCIAKGRHYLVSTLIEEIFHRDSGFGDQTREFQTFTFEKIVGMMQQQSGEYL
jgi:hypothetical protein